MSDDIEIELNDDGIQEFLMRADVQELVLALTQARAAGLSGNYECVPYANHDRCAVRVMPADDETYQLNLNTNECLKGFGVG